jgi:hypothetical protein
VEREVAAVVALRRLDDFRGLPPSIPFLCVMMRPSLQNGLSPGTPGKGHQVDLVDSDTLPF